LVLSLLLRFRDYDAPTFSRHMAVIKRRGYVWWGWWKRVDEPFQGDALAEAIQRCPMDIGIYSRVDGQYYSARCEGIRFAQSQTPQLSPEPIATPAYYRKKAFPAWFKLASLTRLTEEQFAKKFVGVPSGTNTLHLVEKTQGKSFLREDPHLEAMTESAPAEAILHLSDVHFGEDHSYPEKRIDRPILRETLCDHIIKRLERLGVKIGVVVVSGDFITKADVSKFNAAREFLEELVQRLGLTRHHVVLVPGNHDIKIEDHATHDYRHEAPFKEFLKAFYQEDIPRVEIVQEFETLQGWSLVFASLNSIRPRTPETKDYGYVGHDRSEEVLQIIRRRNSGKTASELVREKRLNFVVLHHHLLPTSDVEKPQDGRQVSLTLDAGRLIRDFLQAGIHFGLHGHQHVAFVGGISRARREENTWIGHDETMYVLGVGSAGVKPSRLSPELMYNTFGIYTPRGDGFHIQIEEFNEAHARTHMDVLLPWTGSARSPEQKRSVAVRQKGDAPAEVQRVRPRKKNTEEPVS
jgi:3',5'-cyclic AMP phosphodiesterase CpdA